MYVWASLNRKTVFIEKENNISSYSDLVSTVVRSFYLRLIFWRRIFVVASCPWRRTFSASDGVWRWLPHVRMCVSVCVSVWKFYPFLFPGTCERPGIHCLQFAPHHRWILFMWWNKYSGKKLGVLDFYCLASLSICRTFLFFLPSHVHALQLTVLEFTEKHMPNFSTVICHHSAFVNNSTICRSLGNLSIICLAITTL